VRPREPLPLDWLGPALDRCRALIEGGIHEIRHKPGGDGRQVVTDIDLAVERTLIAAIHAQDPAAAIFSEETQHDPRVLDERDTCFVIDPIDGTNELVAGRDGFAISVAEYRSGLPAAALLDFPRHGDRFEGGAGAGTWREDRRVQLPPAASLEGVRLAVSASQYRDASLRPAWDLLQEAELVPTPAFTPKLASILRGECVAALHLPVDDRRTYLWDYAAAAMLLAEADGVFVTWAGEDLLRARPLLHVGGWIGAANPELQVRLRETLRPALDQLRDLHR
jgi:myo-inositol-1(or 4)-monophosphatase